jgi:hypothetical protein
MSFFVDAGGGEESSVLIAGSGRSGTTWIGEVLATVMRAREIFEPLVVDDDFDIATLKGRKLEDDRLLRDYQIYVPPELGRRSRYYKPLDSILCGQVRNRWCDGNTRSGVYRRRLIKDIRSNLALAYIARQWSRLRIVWVIRDPISVIGSQLRVAKAFGYTFDFKPINVLFQPRLVADWLADHVPLMQSADSKAERLAHRWCVETMVPLWQGAHRLSNIKLVRYEDLVEDTGAWDDVLNFVGLSPVAARLDSIIARPSRTARTAPGDGPADALTPDETAAIRAIVESYGAAEWLAGAPA